MKNNSYLLLASATLILVSLNIHNISAFYWKAENATVHLKNCTADCELKGTLSVIPFDGRYKLTTETGEVIFTEDAIKLISVPINSKED